MLLEGEVDLPISKHSFKEYNLIIKKPFNNRNPSSSHNPSNHFQRDYLLPFRIFVIKNRVGNKSSKDNLN